MEKENRSEIKRKILTAFMVAALLVCSFSFNSLESNAAVVDEYYLDYAEPTCSNTQGYVSLALQNNRTGEMEIVTFFWNTLALSEEIQQPCLMYFDIVNDYEIVFAPYGNLAYVDSAMYTLTRITPDSIFVPYYPTTGASSKVSWAFGIDGYTFVGFKYGGNAMGDFAQSQGYNFALYFATDGSSKQLMQIYSVLTSSNSLTMQQLSSINSIMSNTDTVESKLQSLLDYASGIRSDLTDIKEQLDEILGEEKKQTSWLQKIWEALTGSSEQKDKIDEESSKAEQQAGQLGQLNEQNKTDKVDPGQANDSVNSAIDKNQIQNYSIVLGVFTNESHIAQMLLIVIAIALVGYVFFGKR